MNKIVASYDSLRYCQCDIGRKQNKNKTKQKKPNRTTYFMQAADVTWWTEGGKLQRLLGWRKTLRATRVQQEVRV